MDARDAIELVLGVDALELAYIRDHNSSLITAGGFPDDERESKAERALARFAVDRDVGRALLARIAPGT